MQSAPTWQAIAAGRGAAVNLFAVINRVPQIDSLSEEGKFCSYSEQRHSDLTTGLKPEKLSGEIEFRNVTFRYPSRPDETVLENFNLKIKPGKTVAIVGERSSKSPIMKIHPALSLMQRLRKIHHGAAD